MDNSPLKYLEVTYGVKKPYLKGWVTSYSITALNSLNAISQIARNGHWDSKNGHWLLLKRMTR
jgi:hypothetical protein